MFPLPLKWTEMFLVGKGSFCSIESAKYQKLFFLEGKVELAKVELSNAVPVLKNGQIDGFVTAGSFPAQNVIKAAAYAGAKVISFPEDQVKASKRTCLIIPAGTYAGQTEDIITTSLPVVAFTTPVMDDETVTNSSKPIGIIKMHSVRLRNGGMVFHWKCWEIF